MPESNRYKTGPAQHKMVNISAREADAAHQLHGALRNQALYVYLDRFTNTQIFVASTLFLPQDEDRIPKARALVGMEANTGLPRSGENVCGAERGPARACASANHASGTTCRKLNTNRPSAFNTRATS